MSKNIYQNENIKEYALSLVENKRKINDKQVGFNIENILLVIAKNPCSSIDKIYELINQDYRQKKNKTIGYEYINTAIRKLEKLGLIKKVEVAIENNISNTYNNREISYSVSTEGLFYIFRKNLASLGTDIILKNRNNHLFKIFLYQYIELDTLEKLESKDIRSAISKYLSKCAKIFDADLLDKLIEIEKNNGERTMVGFPNSSLIPEDNEDIHSYGTKFSIGHLKKKYNINWLDENNIKIVDEVTENKKTIRISNEKGKEELILEIYPETNKAILLDNRNNQEIGKFDIERHPFEKNSYIMFDLDPFTVSEYLDNLISKDLLCSYLDIEYNVHELCFSILQDIHYDYYASADRFRERQGDCEILVKDRKFCKLANEARGTFDTYYYHELDLYS